MNTFKTFTATNENRSKAWVDLNKSNKCSILTSKDERMCREDEIKGRSIDLQLQRLLFWLRRSLVAEEDATACACSALATIQSIIKSHTEFAQQYWVQIFHPKNTTIYNRFLDTGDGKNNELVLSAILCMDTFLGYILDTQMETMQIEACEAIANAVLKLHFTPSHNVTHASLPLLISSLTLFNKIIILCPLYTQTHASELFGFARTYINYGCPSAMPVLLPQKVYPSQQAICNFTGESSNNESGSNVNNCGGKVLKTRKPRAITKSIRQSEFNSGPNFINEGNEKVLNFDVKISDSEASEQESAGNSSAQDRRRCAELRLAAITMMGNIAKLQERRILFGYWHAFFPSGFEESQNDNLLCVAYQDPSTHCRNGALQVSIQMLFGSKIYLQQAESCSKYNPTTFLPFAQSLGQMILAIYDVLIKILSSESSLTVLVQALKCLAVLIQATPFQRLETGFVSRFVYIIRSFVYHRDSTIQVAALMVMEFLVATTEVTLEIADSIGMTLINSNCLNKNLVKDKSEELVELENFEESVDSDYSESDNEETHSLNVIKSHKSKKHSKSSWLLLRIFENLNVNEQSAKASVSVRIESLQVLSALTTHFSFISSYVEQVIVSLQHCLLDPSSDIRLYAARCIDICGYHMGRSLLNKTASTKKDIEASECFWAKLLPIITKLIGGMEEQRAVLRACLCDALSNIGIITFERLPHSTHMNLITFLSGISSDNAEEKSVRAAAVRAMAVFVLFPSLKTNFVFIENLAELILHLVTDSNLAVRIKVFWAMGNISDVLINNTSNEKISDNLLKRLIEAADRACNDNDKVRCNAVRTLGNLLCLLTSHHLDSNIYRTLFQGSIRKLIDCIRSAGNAKVKWNSCYAVGNLMKNQSLFIASKKFADFDWQTLLYPALCHVIVHHSNFKVRINATIAIGNIENRAFYGTYLETFWASLVAAIEQSYNLDNFNEYNHRDHLQEQLCIAMSKIIACAQYEDFIVLKKHLAERIEVVRSTWTRVISRLIPEKSAPLLSCSVLLQERFETKLSVSSEHKHAVLYIAKTFSVQ